MVSTSGTWCEGEDIERLEMVLGGQVKFILISTSITDQSGFPRLYFTPFGDDDDAININYVLIAYDEGVHYSLMRYADRTVFTMAELPWTVSWLASISKPPFRRRLLRETMRSNN
jgi:hypothetical protein